MTGPTLAAILLVVVYVINEINQMHKKISMIMQVLPKFCDRYLLLQ